MSNDKVEATYHPEAPKVPNREQIAEQLGVEVTDIPARRDNWVQWEGIYVGGGQGEGVHLTMHKACGAYVGDREQHARVCTAPPWEPTPVNIGETHDWQSDGSRT